MMAADIPIIKLKIIKRGFWDFSEDIPLLTVSAHPSQSFQRIKEEIDIFNTWKKYNPGLPFDNLRYHGGNVFLIDVDCVALFGAPCGSHRKLTVTIICPSSYPRAFPRLAENPRNLHDRIFREYVSRATRHAVYMCIPAIQRIWWYRNTPYAGIAHFLNIFLIWFSISSERVKKTKIDFFDKRTTFV